MAQNTVSTGFSMYNPRRLERVSFGSFAGAGIDQFTDPVAQDPNKFLNLTNVLPTVTGGFNRRWGLTYVPADTTYSVQFQRMFSYTIEADTTFTGSVTSRKLLGTDNTHIRELYNEIFGAAGTYPAFGGTGNLFAVTSRDWFYMSDGVGTPQKNYPGNTVSSYVSRWGIPTPGGTTVEDIVYMTTNTGPIGTVGTGYTSSPTLSFTGGGGSGAAATLTWISRPNGGLSSNDITITNMGSGYTSAPVVVVTGGVGSGATFTAIVETNPNSPYYQQVIGIVMTGNLLLNSGRTYAIALQNSISGHVSDYIYGEFPVNYPLIGATDSGLDSTTVINQGVTSLGVTISIPDSSVDAQVDTVILMATSDGGDVEHLYQVAKIPLSSFTHGGGNYSYEYIDTLPDTYNDVYQTGPTLLTQNLWVDIDANGNVIGINDNTPPLNTYNKAVINQGRMFATDGRAIYFSKSIDEVTTSTGLITSKWEEAWPGSNELDIAYDDELVTALLSDGEQLYIGTTDNVYRLTGSSAASFSIPTTIWRGVGVKSQDAWAVVYKDNIPAGYVWVTSDNKIMFSDFNTYNEIGRPVYPLLNSIGPVTHVQSLSYGPYSFAVLSLENANGPTYLLFDTKGGGWYLWTRALPSPSGSYILPIFSYTLINGVQQLYTLISLTPAGASNLFYFNPAATQDLNLSTFTTYDSIPWFIETSWINLQDTASSVILNELELWSDDPYTTITIHRALVSTDFDTPILVKSGTPILTPFGNKLPLAGANSFGRFHKAQFYTNTTTGLSTVSAVLRQFQFEMFPHARA